MTGIFDGRPDVGADEQAFLLVTVGDDGWPHVCLLSRAEIEADGADEADEREVRVVVRSRRTRTHLTATGQALLLAVVGGAARKWRLRVVRTVDDDGALAAALAVESAEDDRFPGVDLRPMHYVVTEDVPSVERWADNERLLRELASPVNPPGAATRRPPGP